MSWTEGNGAWVCDGCLRTYPSSVKALMGTGVKDEVMYHFSKYDLPFVHPAGIRTLHICAANCLLHAANKGALVKVMEDIRDHIKKEVDFFRDLSRVPVVRDFKELLQVVARERQKGETLHDDNAQDTKDSTVGGLEE